MDAENLATEYLLSIVRPLTKFPEQVQVRHHIDDAGRGIVLNVIAEKDDLALLIGKHGLMARCIRNILRGWCGINNARIILHIGSPVNLNNENEEEN